MTPSRPNNETIFHAAREISDLDRRREYVREACGGDEVRIAHVEALLAAAEAPDSLLDRPAGSAPVATSDEPITAGAGTLIGPYKLIEQIGEGGMGTVWLAQQFEPVKRLVAVKLIKAGMDTKQVLARFDAERQALAIMDHANIARVLDAGTSSSGRPYFVMDLVKGVPITRYCDEHRLTPRQRLELFVPICQAVQHAHQKGIIHRDLKPSNVLVASYDGKPVPKVIDFGVAKAAGSHLTEKTLVTGFGAIVGTLEYMSPEQAEINQLDIDTRSDIYSLGVLLYELLTGSPPFTRKALEKAGMLEMLRVIREQEPSKPSTKLSSAEHLPALAADRGTESAKLTKLVRGDLDLIVMKALEKDRNRRYETANAFARDVQCFLADEPVLACPPSIAYKLKKFAQRNRAAVMAAAIILLLLVAGIAGTTYGLIRAVRARADEAMQRGIAVAEKKKAEQAEADTLADYRASTDDAIEQLIGSKPDLGPQERTYLEKTLKRWQAFASRQGDDVLSQRIRAEGHQRVAYLWQRLARRDEARAEYETARELRKKLVAAFPDVSSYRHDLASSHSSLGAMLYDLGQRDAARTEFETARAMQQQLVATFPAVSQYQRELSKTHHNLAVLFNRVGQRDAARAEFEAARDLQQKLAAAFPAVPLYRQDLAKTHHNIGVLMDELLQREAARREFESARDLRKKLATAFPMTPEYQVDLAHTHNSLGTLLSTLDQREAARAEYVTALEIQQKVVAAFPSVPEYQEDLAGTHNNLGVLLYRWGHRDAARAEHEKARELHEKLAAAFPTVPAYQVDLGASYCNFGMFIRDGGQPADSLTWFDLAIRTLTPVYEHDRRAVTAKAFLRNSHVNRARAYDALKKHAEALKDWDRTVELSSSSERPTYRAGRAISRLQAGNTVEAVAEVEELTKTPNWTADNLYDFACVYAVACATIADKKLAYADRAMELLQQAVKAGYKDGAHMAMDSDLNALHPREDFKKLLAGLKAGKQ